MIPPTGQKTFTSPQSLSFAHRLRKKADAIITGSGTILTDEPHFTVRHINDHVGKRRWLGILDRRQRVSKAYIALAKQRGLDAIIYSNIHEALADLREKEAQDILVEAGPQLSQSFLDQNLWSLAITLHQGAPDRMETRFHPQSPIFFETRTDDWLPMP